MSGMLDTRILTFYNSAKNFGQQNLGEISFDLIKPFHNFPRRVEGVEEVSSSGKKFKLPKKVKL